MIAASNTTPWIGSDGAFIPGVYPGLSDSVYHSWDLISNSRLSDVDGLPEMCEWVRKHGKERTEAMRLGTAFHTSTLEPERLAEEFVEPEPCSGIVKSTGKRCGAMSAKPYGDEDLPVWLCGRHCKGMGEPLEVDTLTPAQRIALGHMMTNVLNFKDAARMLDLPGDRELSIIYERDGLVYKARVDLYVKAAGGILGDIKTCPDPTLEGFGRKVFTMGYLRQLAKYRRALKLFEMPVAFASIIAQQSVIPYATRVYHVPSELIDLGEEDLDRLDAEYRKRSKSNNWIGNDGEAVELDMPAWAVQRIERRVAAAHTTETA